MLRLSLGKYSSRLALLLVGLLLIAAISCGGSDDDDDGDTPAVAPTTASGAATAAPTTAAVEAPDAIKRGGVLKYGMDPNNNHVFFQQYTPGAGSACAVW